LFAIRTIRKGAKIIEYRGARISESAADDQPSRDPANPHHTFLFQLHDGTVIDAARRLGQAPLLGVQSASSSRGHFCITDAVSFRKTMQRILEGELQPLKVMRLRALIDGEPIGNAVLNEIFAESANGTASYIIRIGDVEESHQSDGVMIGPASGSTAWMSWYGSEIMDITDRRVQYIVRGPNPWMSLKLTRGILTSTRTLQIVSKMENGYVAVDGRRNTFPCPRGGVLTVRPSRRDLKIYVDPRVNEAYRVQSRAS